jgi:hypothetical protein
VPHDLSTAVWRKSGRSNGDGNVCVEIALLPGAVAVRDSKNATGGTLVIPSHAWDQLRIDPDRPRAGGAAG